MCIPWRTRVGKWSGEEFACRHSEHDGDVGRLGWRGRANWEPDQRGIEVFGAFLRGLAYAIAFGW